MTRKALMIIAGLAFLPLAAWAQPGQANAILRDHIHALGASGFPGLVEIQVPQAPGAVQGAPAANQVDETTEALAALIRELKEISTMEVETAKALGFDLSGDLPIKYLVGPKIQDVIRLFSATTFRGTTDIIIQDVRRANDRKELRSYRIGMNGTLEAAAVTVKVNGKYQSEKIPVSTAQAGCQKLLEFWRGYYRENLKKP